MRIRIGVRAIAVPAFAAGSPANSQQDAAASETLPLVTAVARVVLDPVGAHFEPGESLAAQFTDPGWAPLFLTAGRLVMEMGGANSHGAVVAREYGIPAVAGVANGTGRIASGARITVDGSDGTITPEQQSGS